MTGKLCNSGNNLRLVAASQSLKTFIKTGKFVERESFKILLKFFPLFSKIMLIISW